MKKKIIVVALFLIMSILAACGSNSTKEDNPETSSGDKIYDKVKEAGKIEVGSTSSGPPFTFLNTKTGEIDGYMVDVTNYIGENMGLEMNINSVQWASLIPSVDSGKIDMISAAMAVTDERKEILDFTDIVYSYGETIVVLKGNGSVKSVEDLKGLKVGVQEASIYYNGIQDYPEIEYQAYKTHQDMAKELMNGRIDVFFADYPIFKEMLKELPELKDKVEVVRPEEKRWLAEIAIAVPKGSSELLENVNAALAKMEEEGIKDEFIEKWDLK